MFEGFLHGCISIDYLWISVSELTHSWDKIINYKYFASHLNANFLNSFSKEKTKSPSLKSLSVFHISVTPYHPMWSTALVLGFSFELMWGNLQSLSRCLISKLNRQRNEELNWICPDFYGSFNFHIQIFWSPSAHTHFRKLRSIAASNSRGILTKLESFLLMLFYCLSRKSDLWVFSGKL